MNDFKQTHLGAKEEGTVFTFCGKRLGMDALSLPVRKLVEGEVAHNPKREFLTSAYEALRGSREILTSRNFADQALYCVASRQQQQQRR
jgi:hypothetical protein